MKSSLRLLNVILATLLIVSAAAPCGAAASSSGEFNVRLVHDGMRRLYHAHVPASYTGKKPVPVVVVLHGGGGTWVGARKGSQMDKSADTHGFIAIYPNAGPSHRWNIGGRETKKVQSDLDDIGFFRAMLDDIARRWNVDPKRIYFTGLSNGGFMSYRVACEMSDRVAAVAGVGCALPFSGCAPGRPISVLHVHGTDDKWIPLEGGVVRTLGDPVPSTQEVVNFWLERNQCSQPKESFRNGTASCSTATCAGGTEVSFCRIEGGGHVWPGGVHENDRAWYRKAVGWISPDYVSREKLWEFFEKHSL